MTNNKKVGRAIKATKGQELLGKQGELAKSAARAAANVKETVKGRTAPTKQNPQANSWGRQGVVVGMDTGMRDEAVLAMNAAQGSQELNEREWGLGIPSTPKYVVDTKAMNQARAFHALHGFTVRNSTKTRKARV